MSDYLLSNILEELRAIRKLLEEERECQIISDIQPDWDEFFLELHKKEIE